ncbi:GGDEF domain-containing response regulator [Pseudoalteromonas sp. Of7M-16]|uniref:two-component system response regulator n=1 Tax=Pseudoalteromonas sp. Of7M-16 TaxID=2917756 RepID=UPI001EF5459E|nr:GGDEF domain-containing response regulator [Pseudoalteromonas sp. Of7M-16]MCG7548108.1 EAL domain-containing protein [Pseudoalteromonas sp. Of7M-16]
MNILLVDDEKIDRELVKEALFCSGKKFNIKEAISAEDGLTAIAQDEFDIVLLDYQMPKQNGLQLLMTLKSKNICEDCAIIMITNNRDEELLVNCINAGAQDLLLKDEVTSTQLIRCIKQSQRRIDLQNKLTHSYQQVKQLAERDTLTGLFNRRYFENALTSLLVNMRSLDGYVVVMLLDIDGFKLINDSLGHSAGDVVLKEFANRVKSSFRESPLFARLGGDEFAFVFSGVRDSNAALAISERLLSSFDEPFHYDKHQIHSTASIGITLCASKTTSEDMLKQADIAMYKAKKQKENKACFFDESLEREFYRLFQIENELRTVIKNHNFDVFFQPIFNTTGTKIIAIEALVRLPVGDSKASPAEFIIASEKLRLIETFGRMIIQKSLAKYAQLVNMTSSNNIALSINLSPLQIHDLNLNAFIVEQAKLNHVNLSNVIVEVTETALLENNTATLETLKLIKSSGCQIALDDFGTGFSSISHLLNYPIDIVKLDKSLIERTVDDKKAQAMLDGLTSMLHGISIETVAEGVECKAHVDVCQRAGVSRLQGYFFGKPMPVDSLIECILNSSF